MSDTNKFAFFKVISLYLKVISYKNYIERYSYLDKSENIKILEIIKKWLDMLEITIINIVSENFSRPDLIGKSGMDIILVQIDDCNKKFRSISENMRYIPLIYPSPTIKIMFDEFLDTLKDEMKIKNVYFKTIPESNFTESRLIKPNFSKEVEEKNKMDKDIPNVLSMTALYRDNPLMWPLIFHEYGHTVFKKFNTSRPTYYNELINEIRKYALENHISNLSQLDFNKLISEVFSDIFAINYYDINYFLDFYFYEFLRLNSCDLTEILQPGFELSGHPPSSERIRYMIKELKKLGFENDEILCKILYIQNNTIYNSDQQLKSAYKDFFDFIYLKISSFIEINVIKEKPTIPYQLIKNSYDDLQNRYPIGTYYDGDQLENDLLSNKKFDIEKHNKIKNIIYTGWKYLIFDIIDSFYQAKEEDYLTKCLIKKDDSRKNLKINKFNNEYNYLLSNLNYSMETSLIVSHYIGEAYL